GPPARRWRPRRRAPLGRRWRAPELPPRLRPWWASARFRQWGSRPGPGSARSVLQEWELEWSRSEPTDPRRWAHLVHADQCCTRGWSGRLGRAGPGGWAGWLILTCVRAIRRFTVRTVLPEPLSGLNALALNLRWAWHEPTRGLLAGIDPQLWQEVHGDPAR